jgi:hypothetical protein
MVIIPAMLRCALTALLKKSVENNKIKVLLYLLIGAPLLCGFSFPQASFLRESERAELESFFRLLLKKSEFGYTLFGDKPLSFFSYCIKPPPGFLIFTSFTDPKIEKHYLTYQKYKDKLSTKSYIILDQICISNKFPTSESFRDILIINKQAFSKSVHTYLPLFKERLGENASADNLLLDIELGKNVLFDVLKEDELLWGILLGYGAHNAEIYARREAIKDGGSLFPTHNYSNLGEELDAIDDLLVGFTHEYFIDLIPLPMFLCDKNHVETQLLKSKYQKVQEHIHEVYNSPDFLNLVLQQLSL